MDDYQQFIAISRYARWIEEENRREDWRRTVKRYRENVVIPRLGHLVDPKIIEEVEMYIYTLQTMPSMRAMMTAGPALLRDNTCAFNCAYISCDSTRSFDEAMFILLCGTGVGFTVERQDITKLPTVPEHINQTGSLIQVEDSKEGWSDALRSLIDCLYVGTIPMWDVSKVRPAGARLKTFGGRASGPAPLVELFNFVIHTFKEAAGRKLNSLECHDMMCKIGEVVVVGGVRRSAMISLSNLSDGRMREAKSGAWYVNNKQRALANNSTCYTEKPDMESFIAEWQALVASKSGERGIFNRQAAVKQVEKYGKRKSKYVAEDVQCIPFGTNPCSEIILRPYQFCNLSEVVARHEDTFSTLKKKVEIAAILGTVQASLTDFPYLRDIWRENTQEESLLGVSITGIMDSPYLRSATATDLDLLRLHAEKVNKQYEELLGIPAAAAITCVKPSGTVSQLTDSSSGIHRRHSPYYIRTVRGDNKDPLTAFMKYSGVPSEPCVMKPDQTTVFSFPIIAPKDAVFRNDMTAIEQLEFWTHYQRNWCEHKPSVTIDVKSHEWMEVGAYVYKNFDEMSGVSFLPTDDNTYEQAPYQEITEEQYNEARAKMPHSINWGELSQFEFEDNTSGSQTLACSAGACEIVDIN